MNAADLIEQIKNSNDTFRKSQCRHTMPDGERCGSPAMHGEKFCYYHHETRKPVADPQLRQARRNAFQLPKPTSRSAIQDALGQIITRIAYNDIDPRRAGLLLYALQLATTNLKDHQSTQPQHTTSQTAQQQTAQQASTPAATQHNPVIPTGAAQEGVIPTGAQRSGGICFSTDTASSTDTAVASETRIPSPQPTEAPDPFEAEVFPPPQPQLRPIRRDTFAALLDSLARHHGVEPSNGSPEDRKTETIPTLQGVAQPAAGRRNPPRHSSRVHRANRKNPGRPRSLRLPRTMRYLNMKCTKESS